MNQRRKRLLNLFAKSNKCHWCKCVTRLLLRKSGRLQGGNLPDDAATLDHLYAKPRIGKGETVLACHKCNKTRGIDNNSDKQLFESVL